MTFTAAGLDAVCVPSDVFDPVMRSVTWPALDTTWLMPALWFAVPVLSLTPRSARLSAAETSPVATPAPISVESTEMVTDVLDRVTLLGALTGSGDAVAVIGTDSCVMPGVTLAQPFVWVVSADAGYASGSRARNAPTRMVSAPSAIRGRRPHRTFCAYFVVPPGGLCAGSDDALHRARGIQLRAFSAPCCARVRLAVGESR